MVTCCNNTSVAINDFLEHQAELQDFPGTAQRPYFVRRLLHFPFWPCGFVHILCVYVCLHSYHGFQVTTALQSIEEQSSQGRCPVEVFLQQKTKRQDTSRHTWRHPASWCRKLLAFPALLGVALCLYLSGVLKNARFGILTPSPLHFTPEAKRSCSCCPAPSASVGQAETHCLQITPLFSKQSNSLWEVYVWGGLRTFTLCLDTHNLVADLTAGAHIRRTVPPASSTWALLGAGMDWLLQFITRLLHGWTVLGSN